MISYTKNSHNKFDHKLYEFNYFTIQLITNNQFKFRVTSIWKDKIKSTKEI